MSLDGPSSAIRNLRTDDHTLPRSSTRCPDNAMFAEAIAQQRVRAVLDTAMSPPRHRGTLSDPGRLPDRRGNSLVSASGCPTLAGTNDGLWPKPGVALRLGNAPLPNLRTRRRAATVTQKPLGALQSRTENQDTRVLHDRRLRHPRHSSLRFDAPPEAEDAN
jgi:hypothetical protein